MRSFCRYLIFFCYPGRVASINRDDLCWRRDIDEECFERWVIDRPTGATRYSAICSLRSTSTIDAVYESEIAGSPTLATTRRPRRESNATPFGLTPTPILKAFSSPPGVNTETVFSPRLVVNTKPRALDTSAPATAVNPGIESTYRSSAQSITSIESLAVCAT